jgi:SAM-dependent methyltransferase
MRRRALFTSFLEENPFQPATGYWRSIEIDYVLSRGLPHGRGIDIGCGDGRLMAIVVATSGEPRELVGIDIDPAEVQTAAATGVYSRLHVARGNRIPEAVGSFDWAFSNSTLEHIRELDGTLAEVARLLRPGGVFIATVPSSDFHRCLAGPLWGDRSHYLEAIDARCAHLRYLSPAEWQETAARAGLELMESESYLSAAEVRRWESLSRFTAGILYAAVRGRRQPIEIQRSLGLRHPRVRIPRIVARPLAVLLASRVHTRAADPQGCLYLVFRRAQVA